MNVEFVFVGVECLFGGVVCVGVDVVGFVY